MAAGLLARGCRVTIFSAAHAAASPVETVDGVRYVRRGSKTSVYPCGLWMLIRKRFGRVDLVVDVQNGMPFLTRLVTRCPVIVLVHHLHRLQWSSYFGPVFGRIGWWLESWLAPRVYRKCRYVTVSEHTRTELVELGIDDERIVVVPNGLDPTRVAFARRDSEPLLVAVSRLVPHKQIEHAIEAVARLADRWPTLRLEIVGRGPWDEPLLAYAAQRGVADRITVHGWVDEQRKHEILARSWVHLCPSVKEGWGIVVMEAGAHGVPTVAYRAAGGVGESVLDRRTGMLADDLNEFVAATELLLCCERLRTAMGAQSREHVATFEWKHSVDRFDEVVRAVLPHRDGDAAPAPRRAT